ncbi:PEP-utilizing enzyme [Paenibacillus polymyxa]|uniref:PEP-utilizing enzyme n=1 Tax=Paenibacillus polymyxa TaxID=1406 RepID=UPI000FAD2670|nr:hypothetical protein H6F38_20430 [Paenibacillus sp. EKM208P]
MSSIYQGVVVNPGVYRGKAYVVSEDNHRAIEQGEVLVVPHSHPRYSLMLFDAGSLICESGATMAHICIVAGEIGLPCLTQVAGAMQIPDGCYIEVDGNKGEVKIIE